MNPCSRYKKQIALLAAKSLSGKEASQVREHLNQCGRCQEYWNDVSLLCEGHFDLAEKIPTVEMDGRFHQQLVDRINANERAQDNPRSVAGAVLEAIARSRWKVVLGSTAALALAGLLAILVSRPAVESPAVHSASSPVPAKKPTPPPTLMAYRMAASRSFEELDALLAKEADRLLPTAPLMAASIRRELDNEE